ncbi:MAG TPA: protein kinase, partial [Planctomycetaceae bacterium]
MNDMCSIEMLKSALAGNLSPDEEAAVADHLERCESCSSALESMAAEPVFCREAATLLAADALDDDMPPRDEWSLVDFGVEYLEPATDPSHLGRLGGYDVLQVIGSGGMGVVLKGFDPDLKRSVAIKVLAPHLAHSSLARKRFAREAQAAAAIVHPHVLAIHQVQPNGRLPFIVMPLVAGESLAERLASQGHLELKEVLRIGMQAAAGLAAAHEQGLVHRDVKPANILLERGIERAVLTDFGLARAADDVAMTRWGIIAGTPQYMSPEQARGEGLDHRSDLFSLGCVLYEMATGVSPFKAESTIATLRRLMDEPPRPLASHSPELPHWFVQIVERLLEKDPSRRFGSATEVSELLAGCLAHLQQPATVPLPAGLALAPTTNRRPFPSSLKRGVFVMLATLAVIVAAMFALQPGDSPDRQREADGVEADAQNAVSEAGAGDEPEVTSKPVNVEPRFLGQFSTGIDVQTIAASPDGKLIAIANGNPTLTVDDDGKTHVAGDWQPIVHVVDAATKEMRVWFKRLESSSSKTANGNVATWQPKPLTTSDEDTLWKAIDRSPPFEVAALAFSPDASLLAIGTRLGQVKLFNIQSGKFVRSLDDAAGKRQDKGTPEQFQPLERALGSVKSLAFSPDGSLLATCGRSFGDAPLVVDEEEAGRLGIAVTGPGRVKVWEVETGKLKHDLVGHSYADAVAFSPNGALLASAGSWVRSDLGDRGNGVILWDPRDGSRVLRISTPTNAGTHSVAFSPDSKLLAIGSVEIDKDKMNDAATGVITLARAGSGLVEWQLRVAGGAKLAFSPAGPCIVLHGQRAIELIDSSTGTAQSEIKTHDSLPERRWNGFAILSVGRLLA